MIQTCQSLLTLPMELLMEVLSYIPHDSSLLSVLMVSHVFRNITEPLLYRNINFQSKVSDRINQLMNTLSVRPQLGQYVMALSLLEDEGRNEGYFDNADALLRLLPCLEELSLCSSLSGLNLTDVKCLKSLRLHLDRPGAPLQQIARSFWIPSLRVLEMLWVEPDDLDGIHTSFTSQGNHCTSGITDLRLEVCSDVLPINSLAGIVWPIKALKQFTLVTDIDACISHMIDNWLSVDAVAWALEPHAMSLEKLIIAARDGAFLCRSSPHFDWMRFSCLTSLVIPESILGDYCCDPDGSGIFLASLRELQLQHPVCFSQGINWDIYSQRLRALAEVKQARLPALKIVIWWCQMSDAWSVFWEPKPLPHMDSLVQQFEAVGVFFQRVDEVDLVDTPLGRSLNESV